MKVWVIFTSTQEFRFQIHCVYIRNALQYKAQNESTTLNTHKCKERKIQEQSKELLVAFDQSSYWFPSKDVGFRFSLWKSINQFKTKGIWCYNHFFLLSSS